MIRKSGIIIVLLVSTLVQASVFPGLSVSAEGHLGKVSQKKLQQAVDTAVNDGLVGVSVAISTPDDGMVLVAAGVSDKNAGTPLKITDIARIASCSKVWMGAVVLQLVQEGKIALSDKIAKYLSKDNAQHIANADTATVAQLLSHTSGIVDYYNDANFGADVPDKMDFTLDEALQYAWDKPANFKPGAHYAYSNTNTVLLAQAVEKVTGKPFNEVLRNRIFTPLGLKHTYVEVFEPVPVKIVRGYEFNKGGDFVEIGDKYQGGGLPDGALVTSPEDMAIFMRALFDEGKLLEKATLAKMVTPVADSGDGSWIGYHIFLTDTDQGKRYEHDGRINGYRAIEIYYPASKVTIAIWTNSGGRPTDAAWQALQDQVLQLIFK